MNYFNRFILQYKNIWEMGITKSVKSKMHYSVETWNALSRFFDYTISFTILSSEVRLIDVSMKVKLCWGFVFSNDSLVLPIYEEEEIPTHQKFKYLLFIQNGIHFSQQHNENQNYGKNSFTFFIIINRRNTQNFTKKTLCWLRLVSIELIKFFHR